RALVRPYAATAWQLPLMMGVPVERAAIPSGLKPFAWKPAAKTAGGGAVAIAPGSPENFKVVNAALRGQGSVSIARAPFNSGDKPLPAGTFVLDASAAKAAGNAAAETGVRWAALAGEPGGV